MEPLGGQGGPIALGNYLAGAVQVSPEREFRLAQPWLVSGVGG